MRLHFSVRGFIAAHFLVARNNKCTAERKYSIMKKFLSVVLSLVMAVSAMAVFAVSASAEDLKSIESGKQYSLSLTSYGDKQDYKFTAAKSGKLKLTVSAEIETVYINVLNAENTLIKPSDSNNKYGKSGWTELPKGIKLIWNSSERKYYGTLTLNIEKGLNYIRFFRYGGSGTGKIIFKATYPSADSSADVKITSFTLEMKKGDTIQLGTLLSADTDDNIAWKSSKTSVAKVSATGKITAKAKGSATITASVGDSTMKIQVNVS